MDEILTSGPLTICSASQYRYRIELKLKSMLGEKDINGPLDPFIKRCSEEGKIDIQTEKTLLEIARFCDIGSYHPLEYGVTVSKIMGWSDFIEAL